MELNLLIGGQKRKFQCFVLDVSKVDHDPYHNSFEILARVVEQNEKEISPPFEEKLIILYQGSLYNANRLKKAIVENDGIASPEFFQTWLNLISDNKRIGDKEK
jgi:hypothetical protein